MDYLFPAILVLFLGVIYYTGKAQSHKDMSQKPPPSHDGPRKLPWCLTSHRMTDNPCICQTVYLILAEEGFSPDKMSGEQATTSYQRLCKLHPEYPALCVV